MSGNESNQVMSDVRNDSHLVMSDASLYVKSGNE